MVIKLQESGFCAGVRNAVEKADKLYENIPAGKRVYLYGDLVNNKHVMRRFQAKGFGVANDVHAIPAGSIAVIRAHGVPRPVYDDLKNKNIMVEDYTCVKVMKIHTIVAEKSAEGYTVVVVGKKNHPEVIGTVGWGDPQRTFVVEKESDAAGINWSGKVCVVAQTTCGRKLWKTAIDFISAQNASVEIYDTICTVTSDREEKAKAAAKTADVMVVIGDEHSSNSRELYEQCQSACKNTVFISSLKDLERAEGTAPIRAPGAVVGLAASASTPDDILTDVYNHLVCMDLLKSAKKEIEDASCEYLKDFSLAAVNSSFVRQALQSLGEQHEGGKRIRGAMIKLGEQIASHGSAHNYLPVAVGYELFQTAILIHDDIIDNSAARRGKTTIHAASAQNIRRRQGSHISAAGAEHFGVSRALCAGDYGFFISYQFLSKCTVENAVLLKIYQLYSQILTITCEGEIMDVMLPFESPSILDNYEEYIRTVTQIYEYKTAWYTLAGPVMLGAICGGAPEELLSLLKDITIPLGIAFQIKDDLLGIYSCEEVLGKSIVSDIRENKQTLLLGYAYKNARDDERVLLDRHYGKEDADEHDLAIVRTVFETSGAKKHAEDEIQRLSDYSKALIRNDLIDHFGQSTLSGFIQYLVGRSC